MKITLAIAALLSVTEAKKKDDKQMTKGHKQMRAIRHYYEQKDRMAHPNKYQDDDNQESDSSTEGPADLPPKALVQRRHARHHRAQEE